MSTWIPETQCHLDQFRYGDFPVEWHGFESSALRLQRKGWKLFAEQHYDAMWHGVCVTLAFHDREDEHVLMGKVMFRAEDAYGKWHQRNYDGTYRDLVRLQQFKAKDRIYTYQEVRPFDVLPMKEVDGLGYQTFDQLFPEIFSYKEDVQKIIIPESEDELLNRLLAVQFDKQKELIVPQAKPMLKAQILTVAV